MYIEIENFITYMTRVVKAPENTICAYRRDLMQMAKYFESQKQITDVKQVKAEDLENYILYLQDDGKKNTTLSRTVSSMKRFYAYLLIQEEIEISPARDLKAPKIDKQTPDVLTDREFAQIINQTDITSKKGLRDRAMLNLMCTTGMHVSEIINLTVDDVNLKKKQIRCDWNGHVRTLQLDKKCVDSLKLYLKESRPAYITGKTGNVLFTNNQGNKMSRQGLWKVLKNYAILAGIKKNITPHTLRHTVINRMLDEGVSLKDIRDQMGFSDVTTALMYSYLYNRKNVSDSEQ